MAGAAQALNPARSAIAPVPMDLALPLGTTHCELAGPDVGAWVLLLHGGSVPMWCWDEVAAALQAAGFRTLRYDMYGKGCSAIPSPGAAARYDRAFYLRQLQDLLAAVGAPPTLHVVGFSFGGATAANFAMSQPGRLRSLSLIAPACHFAGTSPLAKAARLPLIGPALVRSLLMGKAAERAALLWRGHPQAERYAGLFAQQLARDGFAQAAAAFLRSDALDDYAPVFEALGRRGQSALLLYGSDDEDIPASHITALRQSWPAIQYRELPGVSHGVPFQAAQLVAQALVEHLRGHDDPPTASDR